MSYYNQNQQPNYQRTPQQPRSNYPNQQMPRTNPNQGGRQGMSDPFFNFGDNAFNMDIREDFEDPFEQVRNNGNGQQRGVFMHMGGNMGGPGTMISKTYMSKVDYSSGQPHEESYQSQAIKQFGEGGHNISERQEAYKNSYTGVQKASHQRLLDDRGTKMIKQRNVNTGEQSQHNLYKGIQESDLDNFNKEYNDYREKVHFQDNYKYLNQLNPGKRMKQLGKGKEGQNNNLMLGDGNSYGNYGNQGYNQYQNQPQGQYNNQPQGQYQNQPQGQYQSQNRSQYSNQGPYGNNYQYQKNNY